ncbi:MAG: hybrid sensor histidine kinase/response regulator [Proteobacteria bacterium]|nr:hybrid sensor histidine kinase/response regulator [Pseudomonadota bacterium]MBU1715730.1 hybrid sensor histidine kinase/response regulator [Pseudomonadota bacterium]
MDDLRQSSFSQPSQGRILVVDDEPNNLKLMERFVCSLGYECCVARDGLEALDILRKDIFNILITDMMMPNMDGMELLKYCRKSYPGMDVMVLTGYSSIYTYTDVIGEGAVDFIEKPAGIDELRAKLQRISREQVLRVRLRQEIEERWTAEVELKKYQQHLQEMIDERTLELQRANQQLRMEIEERRLAADEVRSYAEKIKLFAYTVVHDLKTPAIAIDGLSSLLYRKYFHEFGERSARICKQIAKSSGQLVELVDNINYYIKAKENPIYIESFDSGKALVDIYGEFARQFRAKEVAWEVVGEMPQIRGDYMSLIRVFRNYVDNALKYGGNSLSIISVTYSKNDGQHVFKVSDDGIGIGAEEKESIFELFNRSKTVMAKKGTGLGLAIVREIADHHKGSAWVENREPHGTTFCISLADNL